MQIEMLGKETGKKFFEGIEAQKKGKQISLKSNSESSRS